MIGFDEAIFLTHSLNSFIYLVIKQSLGYARHYARTQYNQNTVPARNAFKLVRKAVTCIESENSETHQIIRGIQVCRMVRGTLPSLEEEQSKKKKVREDIQHVAALERILISLTSFPINPTDYVFFSSFFWPYSKGCQSQG